MLLAVMISLNHLATVRGIGRLIFRTLTYNSMKAEQPNNSKKPDACPSCGSEYVASVVDGFPMMNENQEQRIRQRSQTLGFLAINGPRHSVFWPWPGSPGRFNGELSCVCHDDCRARFLC